MNAWRRETVVMAAVLLLATGGSTRAADRFIFQGLFDAEMWKTDPGSDLLSRNEGEAGPAGDLRLWTAGDLAPGLQGYARVSLTGGEASSQDGTTAEVELAFARYTVPGRTRLVIEGGRIQTPVGDFSRRYLSSDNPLIGAPDGYSVNYPYGFKVSGWAGRFDYTVAGIDTPPGGAGYEAEAGRVWRPALAAGVTPVTGFRIGGYVTRGPYLDSDVQPDLPAGAAWRDYNQQVAGFDTQFSRGYFELHGELTRSRYEVPTLDQPARARSWYLEPKYTFSPRVFAALRVEQTRYQEIESLPAGVWDTEDLAVTDAELGVGVRLAAGALLKVSYRRDRWNVDEDIRAEYPDGYAVAAQLSWRFDVVSLFAHPR
jgi:hypothetical protein